MYVLCLYINYMYAHTYTHINVHTYISVYACIQDVIFTLPYLFLASRVSIV